MPPVLSRLMSVRVKICGITNRGDADAAVEYGADALGFIFYAASSRFIELKAAAEIIGALPPFVAKVGVFVDASLDEILRTTRACGIGVAQLHGNETPEFCNEVGASGLEVIKAFRVKDEASLAALETYRTQGVLLDSYVPGQLGGTGEVFNWNLALRAKEFGRPIILAGGLTPENVAQAVESVHPYGVDVSSGVEASPGKKDLQKVRAFIDSAKSGRNQSRQ